MNLEALRDNSFDVDVWMSNLFGDERLDSSQQTKLEDYTKAVENEIQSTQQNLSQLFQQIMNYTPKLEGSIETAYVQTRKLKAEIYEAQHEASLVEKKTSLPMAKLELMNSLKEKLVETATALQEADKWSNLIKLIEQHLDSGDVEKSYECIIGLQKSLSYIDHSRAQDRNLLLEELKNRLEALATKHVIHAFETANLDSSRWYFKMFSHMNRELQFTKYFQNSEKLKLIREWRYFIEVEEFYEAGEKFFTLVLDHVHEKLFWLRKTMDRSDEMALTILLSLYIETLSELDPSLIFCLDSQSRKDSFIETLLHFNRTVHRFDDQLTNFCALNETGNYQEQLSLLRAKLYEPFISQYVKYRRYHEQLLVRRFEKIELKGRSIQEKMEILKGMLPQYILMAKEAMEKVSNFNRGFGFYFFALGIEDAWKRFGSSCEDILKALKKYDTGNDCKMKNLLEHSLIFTEFCGEILEQITNLDDAMTLAYKKYYGLESDVTTNDAWNKYKWIYLTAEARDEINGRKTSMLENTIKSFQKLCEYATDTVMKIATQPGLKILNKNFMVGDNVMGIPSEYITQLGEYIMLLPQNIDPFISTSTEKSSLSMAFQQHPKNDCTKSPMDHIFGYISFSLCDNYAANILRMEAPITSGQAKQLVQDIGYLASVLEDFGVRVNQDLNHIQKLLSKFDEYDKIYKEELSSGAYKIPRRILDAVKRLKNKRHQ